MLEPSLPGIAYSFTADGHYEEAYYRAISNRTFNRLHMPKATDKTAQLKTRPALKASYNGNMEPSKSYLTAHSPSHHLEWTAASSSRPRAYRNLSTLVTISPSSLLYV